MIHLTAENFHDFADDWFRRHGSSSPGTHDLFYPHALRSASERDVTFYLNWADQRDEYINERMEHNRRRR